MLVVIAQRDSGRRFVLHPGATATLRLSNDWVWREPHVPAAPSS